MTIKDVLKKDFGNYDKIILKRFKSAKLLFVMFSLIFFLNYFFLSNFSNNNILIFLLPINYIAFLFSMGLLTFYGVKIKFKKKINNILYIVFGIILIIIGIIFAIPFLFNNKTIENLI